MSRGAKPGVGSALKRGRDGLLGYFVRHRTAANLLMILLVVAGLWAIPRMRAQFFPDIVVDVISVSVAWPGASANDVDLAVIERLEPALQSIEGVSATSSRATEGLGSVTLEFEPGEDMARAEKDVQTAISGLRSLPPDAEDPDIRLRSFTDRVTDIVLTGPTDLDQLSRFAESFVNKLFSNGVTQATISGMPVEGVIVEVPSLALVEHGLSLSEIGNVISASVTETPLGNLAGEVQIKTGAEERSLTGLGATVLRTNSDGSKLRLSDVATLRQRGGDDDLSYFVGDEPAIKVSVTRNATGDAIEIQETVAATAETFEATLPQGVHLTLVNTRAEVITSRLNILLENGAQGLGLVLVLLFLFLNARTAFWVSFGIPVAMLSAAAIMYAFGLTFNIISLFALIITLGIVVDDAIVVGENADSRMRRQGTHPQEAAIGAARKMFAPVLSASLTTILAFLGLMLIGGRFGSFLSDIPFTVTAVLIASLIECFLILPNHLSHATVAVREAWYDQPSRYVNRGFRWITNRLFRPFVRFTLRFRYPAMALAILAFASQIAAIGSGKVQWRFFNSPEQGQVTGNFVMLPTATREDSLEMMAALQSAVEEVAAEFAEEYGRNPVHFVLSQVGGTVGFGISGADTREPYQLGAVAIDLIDPELRPYTSSAFTTRLQDAVAQTPMTETVSFRRWGGGPGGNSLQIDLSGADAAVLKDAAVWLKAELARVPEISGLDDSLPFGKDELVLTLSPRGEVLGFSLAALGRELGDWLSGVEAVSIPDGTRTETITVALPAEELTSDFLARQLVQAPGGTFVPLADVLEITRESGFSVIQRENGVAVVRVTGDLSEDDPARASEVTADITARLLPALQSRFGVEATLGGLREQERAFLADARTSLILVLIGIYLVLTWIFASWSRPLVVMAIIPFGLVGAVFGHGVMGVPLSMFSVVGFLGMTGIIINDSIVLVTTIDEDARTLGQRTAIIEGTASRLRAVFLTTATTIMGLAPLLFEPSTQAEFLKPTVITLVFGLGFGMFLVLMIVPALIAAEDDLKRLMTGLRRGLRAPVPAVKTTVWAALIAALALLAVATFAPVSAPLGARLGLALLVLAVGLLFAWLAIGFWRQRRRA